MVSLTTQINRDFLIRLSGNCSRLVGLSTLADLFGSHFAIKWAKKSLSSMAMVSTFHKNGTTIAFVVR